MDRRLSFGVCSLAIVLGAALPACTTATTETWGPAYYPGSSGRRGRVEWVREGVQTEQGDPAAGAIVGAVIGGIIGGALTGNGGGAAFGAANGAFVGAEANTGRRERRLYQVGVRFEDGNAEIFC